MQQSRLGAKPQRQAREEDARRKSQAQQQNNAKEREAENTVSQQNKQCEKKPKWEETLSKKFEEKKNQLMNYFSKVKQSLQPKSVASDDEFSEIITFE